MTSLEGHGIASVLPDLPGLNESLAPFHEQTLSHWRKCVDAAMDHFGATHALAIRSGAWLAPEGAILYAPVSRASILRSLVRAKLVAAREAGETESRDDLLAQGKKDGIALAGWEVSPALLAEMQDDHLSERGADAVTIAHAEVGGPQLWLRPMPDSDVGQAKILAAKIAEIAR